MSTPAPAQTSTPSDPPPAEILMQVATGHIIASALYGALSIGIPDLLKSGCKSVAELAVLTGTHEGALYRIMVGVGAGSLINLLVQAQTPFNNITLCGSAPNSGNAPNSCGP